MARENLSQGFATKQYSNQPAQLQRLARNEILLVDRFSRIEAQITEMCRLVCAFAHRMQQKSEYDQEIPQSHTADQPTAP